MAANTPPHGGLTPIRMANGQQYYGSGRAYYCSAGGLGIGDPVVKSGTSNTAALNDASGKVMNAQGVPIGAYAAVVKATNGATNRVTGVVVGIPLDSTGTMGGPPALASGTAGVVYVEDDPNVIYLVQASGAGGTHSAADVGLNANLTGNTYDTASGESVVKANSSGIAADATFQLTIEGISTDSSQSDLAKDGVSLLVRINLHTEAPNVAGV